ncbi:MAG: winged helix-turn-helix transcriptional regulator [Bacteroidetes bacterium]|nr:winged helix-turn-helix transcriptional regulator [Bacteroidota bacterium]
MGLSASSIIPLLSKWEEYLSTNPEGDINGFARWVLSNQPEPTQADPTQAETHTPKTEMDATAHAAILIGRIHRILQFQSKPVAKELGFTKPMEFAMLVQTAIMQNPNKKELCQEMLIEGSTGVEITKRLATQGFIRVNTDSKDRRAARLSLTEKGKETLALGYTKLGPIHAGFLDALEPEEKQKLVDILARLNEYHTRQMSHDTSSLS